MQKVIQRAVKLAVEASTTVSPAPDSKPWRYGWCTEEYRRSADASISSPGGPVALTMHGVEKCEELMDLLQKQPQIRERWDLEELWGVVASLIALLSGVENPESAAEKNLLDIMSAKPSIVFFSVANIDWKGPPRRLAGKFIIGAMNDALIDQLEGLVGKSPGSIEAFRQYMERQPHKLPTVGFAAIVPGQGGEAFNQAQRCAELLVDLPVLLDEKKGEHRLYSVRGSSNRPGARGLILERTVVEEVLKSSDNVAELTCQPFVSDLHGNSTHHYWYSASRVPLEILLSDEKVRDAVNRCLTGKTNIARRIQVASRWFSESFWAVSSDDSALAAGVALDSLVGSRSALPGRAMKERYAFLEPEPGKRMDRAREWDEIYSARSAIAHGGESPRIRQDDFLRKMQYSVTWAAWRLLEAETKFGLRENKDLDVLFEDMRWGTRSW